MSKLFLRTARFKFKKFLERLNSRGQQGCKFIGKKNKERFYITKMFNSTGMVWKTNMVENHFGR